MAVRRWSVPVAAIAAWLLLTAGACERRGTRDAPIDTAKQDNQAPYIVNMPNGYMNLALKCVGDDLVIAHTREAAPVVVADSSACAAGEAERIGIPRVGGPGPSR